MGRARVGVSAVWSVFAIRAFSQLYVHRLVPTDIWRHMAAYRWRITTFSNCGAALACVSEVPPRDFDRRLMYHSSILPILPSPLQCGSSDTSVPSLSDSSASPLLGTRVSERQNRRQVRRRTERSRWSEGHKKWNCHPIQFCSHLRLRGPGNVCHSSRISFKDDG